MSDLRRKLARLKVAQDARTPPTELVLPIVERRETWPFEAIETPGGAVHQRRTTCPEHHGSVRVARALAMSAAIASTLALDEGLARFDPSTALFLDTETTGLSGGTGTLPFLIGMGAFEGERFVVEQLFLADLDAEAATLERLSARMERASAIVTYNGKSFDLPLLRTRCVMAGVGALPERPHLDLVHVARRIYGARVEQCQLTTIEREVLNQHRFGDIPGAEIPLRFQRYLHDGERDGLLPVFEHNRQDLAALAALAGELAARVERLESEGRLEPEDLTGLARTSLRAGRHSAAAAMARDAVAQATTAGVARTALVLAAEVFQKNKDPHGAVRTLLEALTHAPDDAEVHRSLSKLYERPLENAERALFHALRAGASDDDEKHARRVERLRKRAERAARQLRLPGFD